jgi:hypothetical protein
MGMRLDAVVFLVHGTFASKDQWHQKGGDFYQAYTAVNMTDTIVTFTWSGKLSAQAHIEAAEALCSLIIKRPYDERKIFIGHSHGGNIINIASHLLDTAQYAVKYEYETMKEKINNLLKIFPSDAQYIKEDFPFSYTRDSEELLRNQKIEEEDLKEQLRNSIENISGMLIEIDQDGIRFVKKRYVMHLVQLLATPILAEKYYPNMSIIERVEQYYSTQDWIQKIGGNMVNTYAPHARLAQIEVGFSISDKSDMWLAPDHGALHNPLMAHWLANKAVIAEHIVPGKEYRLLLHQDGSGFVCTEKK